VPQRRRFAQRREADEDAQEDFLNQILDLEARAECIRQQTFS
jgi:hypothetical protein